VKNGRITDQKHLQADLNTIEFCCVKSQHFLGMTNKMQKTKLSDFPSQTSNFAGSSTSVSREAGNGM